VTLIYKQSSPLVTPPVEAWPIFCPVPTQTVGSWYFGQRISENLALSKSLYRCSLLNRRCRGRILGCLPSQIACRGCSISHAVEVRDTVRSGCSLVCSVVQRNQRLGSLWQCWRGIRQSVEGHSHCKNGSETHGRHEGLKYSLSTFGSDRMERTQSKELTP
jgi:hypothetical protein